MPFERKRSPLVHDYRLNSHLLTLDGTLWYPLFAGEACPGIMGVHEGVHGAKQDSFDRGKGNRVELVHRRMLAKEFHPLQPVAVFPV